MGGEHHLVLPGQPVQDIPRHLLQLRMEKDLRVLHQNEICVLPSLFLICLKKREHVDTPHPFSHCGQRPLVLLSPAPDLRRDRECALNIQIHRICDLIPPSILPEILIHSPGK